jgi:hypothetical protein
VLSEPIMAKNTTSNPVDIRSHIDLFLTGSAAFDLTVQGMNFFTVLAYRRNNRRSKYNRYARRRQNMIIMFRPPRSHSIDVNGAREILALMLEEHNSHCSKSTF